MRVFHLTLLIISIALSLSFIGLLYKTEIPLFLEQETIHEIWHFNTNTTKEYSYVASNGTIIHYAQTEIIVCPNDSSIESYNNMTDSIICSNGVEIQLDY